MDAEVGLIDFKEYSRAQAAIYAQQFGINTAGGANDVDSVWDAFRHAFSSALATAWYGETTAKLLGDMNELWGSSTGQGENQLNQDLWNNAVGRTIGRDSISKQDIANRIASALGRGELIISANTDARKFLPVMWAGAKEYGMTFEDAVYSTDPDPRDEVPDLPIPDAGNYYVGIDDEETGDRYSFHYDKNGNLIDQAVGTEQEDGTYHWEVYDENGEFLYEFSSGTPTGRDGETDEEQNRAAYSPSELSVDAVLGFSASMAIEAQGERHMGSLKSNIRQNEYHNKPMAHEHSSFALARHQVRTAADALIQASSYFSAGPSNPIATFNHIPPMLSQVVMSASI